MDRHQMEREISAATRLRLVILGGALAFSSIFQMGYSNAYPNTAIDNFRGFLNDSLKIRNMEMTNSLFDWIWSILLNSWFIGFALGTMIAVPLTDNFGRKRGLLIGNFITFWAIIFMTLSIIFHVLELFLFGRFLSAISSGISMSSLILFLQEISPLNIRGKMSFFSEMAFVSMNTVGGVLGMRILLGTNLVYLVGLAIIPAIISCCIVLGLHETPKFLFYKKNDIKSTFLAVKFYFRISDEAIQAEIDNFNDEIDAKFEFMQLFKIAHIRKGLILGILCLQLTTSIWAIIYYSTHFLREAKISAETAEYFSSVMFLFSILATLLGFLLIEKFSRKGLFIWASFINVFCLLLFVIFAQLQPIMDALKYGCVLALCVYGISYSFATGPISWFITAELIPIEYRALSQSIALSVNHSMAFFFTIICLPLYEKIGSLTILILFVFPGFICLIILLKYLPETKGRDIQSIINQLKGADGHSLEKEPPHQNCYELRTKVFEKDII